MFHGARSTPVLLLSCAALAHCSDARTRDDQRALAAPLMAQDASSDGSSQDASSDGASDAAVDGGTCASGLSCLTSTDCPLGQPCSQGCCIALACQNGSTCENSDDCADGFACDWTQGCCVPAPQLCGAQTCTTSANCSSGWS